MQANITEILFDKDQIAARVQALGAQITADYQGEELVVISILKGAIPFTADLIRAIHLPVILDAMIVSSYGRSTTSSGNVKIIHDCTTNLDGRHVLVVDDIVDTGNTLKALGELLGTRHPKSLKFCTFLNKPSRRTVDFTPAYIGYDIPDAFVVGYGLDYAEYYRELDHIAVVQP